MLCMFTWVVKMQIKFLVEIYFSIYPVINMVKVVCFLHIFQDISRTLSQHPDQGSNIFLLGYEILRNDFQTQEICYVP
jgi:hypothetical protein